MAYQQYIDNLFYKTPWLVYIKYFIDKDDNNISKPLVVGKTGILSVNKSGVDICFDIKENDNRAARQFLISKGFDWNRRKISVIGFYKEKEALEFERVLIKELNLFGS